MDQHDLEIDARQVQAAQGERRGLRDRPHPDATAHLRPVPHHHAGRREAGDPDLHARARDDDVGSIHERVARTLEDVGGHVVVRGVPGGARQHAGPEVELVVPGSGDVVLQRVEGVDHRVGTLRVALGEIRGEQVALDQVARVDQNDLVRILRPQRLDHACGARQPPRPRDIPHVVPAEHAAMHVRRGDDDDVRGIGDGGRRRGDGLLDGKQRQEHVHSALKIAEGERVALPWTTRMTESESHRVLVVDDEPDITALVAYHLAKAGYRVITAANGRDALRTAREERPDLVVLDLMLPGASGYDVLAELRRREETKDLGIILLTARKDEPDRIKGLSLGADDYLPKPFSPQELVLRVGAVLRRLAAPAVATGGLVTAGPIALDRSAHRVTVDAAEIELTATEFKLLRTLIEREGRVQSRAQLLETVWQAHPDIQTRTVDMHVQRLRQKLGKAGDCIETVRGAGYRFRRPPPEPRGRKRS